MNDEEKNLILALANKSITREEFLKRYPADLRSPSDYLSQLLEQVLKRKDKKEAEYAMLLGFSFGFEKKQIGILCQLLQAKWHEQHEDIVGLMQKFKAAESVDCLYETALTKFDYLKYNDSSALVVKCAWALGDIKTKQAEEKLRLLAQSDNPIAQEAANHQLKRIQHVH
jgi:hypothetical protein